MLISLESIYKVYNGKEVLRDVNFTIENNDRIGLIGVNGSGKTTLLRIINGLENYDKTPDGRGSISKFSGLSIGYLEQNAGVFKDSSIREEMKSVFKELYEMLDKIRNLELKMSENEVGTEKHSCIMDEYSKLSSLFEAKDGYLVDVKIDTVLNGMGFDKSLHERKISTLSGGEKTRLAIAKLLLEEPNLLILDEPTNHLDFKTLIWLEDYLKNYRGALLIVSHDRYFLNKLCNRVFEIERGKLTSYKGDYSSFVVQKEMNTERQVKEYELQQKQISNMQEYVERNKARASTANMAKSRQKAIDRIDLIEKPMSLTKPPKIHLKYDIQPPKDVLSVRDVNLVVGEGEKRKTLINNLSFEIKRGDKVGIIGPNGIGKSSLLKLIQGMIPHSKGKVEWCKNVKISYFDQENAQLDFNNSVLEELHSRFPRLLEHQIRNTLGSVLLTGENVFKSVKVISGGERAKLCFAIMMLTNGNVLILDEPTNHLDLATKEILEKALYEFDGTVIFVSHDRYFINKIATKIIELDSDSVTTYNGNFDHYNENYYKSKEIEQDIKNKEKTSVKKGDSKNYRSKEQRSKDAANRIKIVEIEKEIDCLQAEIDELELIIQNPEICADYIVMGQKCDEIDNLKKLLDKKYKDWELLLI